MADGDMLPALLIAGTLLVLSALPGGALAGDNRDDEATSDGSEGHPTLHLRGDHDGGGSYRNFTTETPNKTDPLAVSPCTVATQGVAEWCWQMHRAPQPWTLEAGADAAALLHLGALDRVPMGPVDPDEPTRSGELRVDVILTRGTSDPVARGTVWLPSSTLGGEEQAFVRVPLEVPRDAHWNTEPGDAPAVELQVHLSGLVRRDEPPLILTGSNEHDSRLVLPGFPMAAFREWEQEEDEAATCRQKILAQHTCEEKTAPAGPEPRSNHTEEAPAAGSALLLVLVLLTLARAGRFRPRT